MQAAIELKHISHSFKNKEVLKDIQLEVKKGEIFGLLGPSGAGKTTLSHIITGQLSATKGDCFLEGTDSTKLTGEHYGKIGVMMDHFGLYERMNCFDNLKFYEMLDGKGTSEIEQVLKRVGLAEAKKTPVSKLSKGMRNRLSFARAVLRRPEVLFLDEPTSGLDPATTEEIHRMILAEKEKGTTIFLTTHNMHEAAKLCDNIALLNEGEIVEYGNPEALCRKYNKIQKFRLHLKNGEEMELRQENAQIETLIAYLRNGEVETLHTSEPDLESIFMELTGGELNQ